MTDVKAPSPALSTARFPLGALLMLSLGVLVTVTVESLPAGILPEMAGSLGVPPLQIGLLISVWALTVIVTSLPLARAVARADRRRVVGWSLAAFAAAGVASAFAPTYEVLFALRIASAAAHALFWSVVIVYATALLRPEHLGRGLAVVTAGGSAATLVGLPLSTLLAQALGWRSAFAVLGALALLIAVAILRGMPSHTPSPVDGRGSTAGGWRSDPSLVPLLVFGAAGILIALGQFASFTYIRPYLSIAVGVGDEWAAPLLLAYGIAGMAGVAGAGWLADRAPRASLVLILAAFAGAFVVLASAPGTLWAVVGALLVWGFAIGAIFPVLQTTLMRIATERTRTLASAGVVVLFNVGIAVGPWVGGVAGGESQPTVVTAVSAIALLIAAALSLVAARSVRTAAPVAA